MPGPAPTGQLPTESVTATVPTNCELDGRPVLDGHCNLTSLDQLKEPRRNLCSCFTKCETVLRQKLL
jgi:hypothetical protein